MFRSAFMAILAMLLIQKAGAQSLPDSVTQKIDSLFKTWDGPGSPGCVVGIVRNDSLIFSKGYGMANLEYGVHNSPGTVYHIASVSKQFTAYAVLLLASQGKLRLDDDIRKYLPWFPDVNQKITIRNLLTHTSGIREQQQLLAIQGTGLDDVVMQRHLINLLSHQASLNFSPGEKRSYSNSNYTLLAEIVRYVTGRSLRQFSDSAIFKPLGMTQTHFHDDYTELVPGRAQSYGRVNSTHVINKYLNYSFVGPSGVMTTVNDMAKWISNFYTFKVGSPAEVNLITAKTILKDGKSLGHGAGMDADTYNGWRQFSSDGADAGFQTYISVFPDLKMGFVVFANEDDFNSSGKAHTMTSLFVKDTIQPVIERKEEKKDEKTAELERDSFMLKKYLGNYISEEGIILSLEMSNHKLYFRYGDNLNLLIRDQQNVYAAFETPEFKIKLYPVLGDTVIRAIMPDKYYTLKKYVNSTPSGDQFLKKYAGRYYCPELECFYHITLKDHHLFLGSNKYDDTPLTLMGTEHLRNDFWWMNHLMVTRDKAGMITGFEVNSGRSAHVKFIKTTL